MANNDQQTPSDSSAKTNTFGGAGNQLDSSIVVDKISNADDFNKFPYANSIDRLKRYEMNDQLFFGNHFDAFAVKVDDPRYGNAYARLRYVAANFSGLVSKVAADMLFSEAAKFVVEDGDQTWLDALIYDNELHTQNYESALGNSRHGDAVYKIRIGKRSIADELPQIIIEDITPKIYFPHLDSYNVRQDPDIEELAWVMQAGAKNYLRKEIHSPGIIQNELWRLEGNKVMEQVSLDILQDPGLLEVEETGIKRNLIVHVPNWKDGSSYFGFDDYTDINTLQYALNNRLTKNDNILDKHSDPILALPEGILDENGQVDKARFHMFEIPDSSVGNPSKPEYIVWNASLDASFKEIDKLMEFLYMFSETSPDAFGMGDGKVDSGRALKLRLMRTIAKTSRKRLYYDRGLKELLYTAQLLAATHGIQADVNGATPVSLTKAPVLPEIIWQDGLPVDDLEEAQLQELRIQSGTQTKKDAIAILDDIDDEAAEQKAKDIEAETAITLPTSKPKLGNDQVNQGEKNMDKTANLAEGKNGTNKG